MLSKVPSCSLLYDFVILLLSATHKLLDNADVRACGFLALREDPR